MYQLTVLGKFAAAHSLRNFKGRCEDLHGHNWRVEVTVRGSELDEADLLMDFGELKKLMNKTLDYLDHRHLNELPPFDEINPSSENIARFIFEEVEKGLPQGVVIYSVAAWENDTSKAVYLKD